MAEWPLVGRTEELTQLDQLMTRGGSGVVIAGPAGVGKTRVGTEALALAAERGFHTVRVSATLTSAALPFGAFASLMPDASHGPDPTETLRRVADAIVARGEAKRVAVLVDDAHLLDEPSAALTHHLATMDTTFVITTVRSTEPTSDAITALWKDGLAERVDLQPLSASEVHDLLERALDGSVDQAVSQLLWTRTEGNALFLRELVLAATEASSLYNDGATWRLTGSLPASPRLIELVEARLDGFDEADRDVLAALAVAEPIGVHVLERYAPGVDIARFEQRSAVRIESDGKRLDVRLGHPVYGEVLRARLSPLRTRTVNRALADALESTGARRREDVLRLAVWRLAGGGEYDPSLMLAGARQAHDRHDLALAERLAKTAWDGGGGFDAGLLTGIVMSNAGRADDAESMFASLEAADDDQVADLAVSRSQNFLLARDIEHAIACVEEAEARVTDRAALAELAAQRAPLLGFANRMRECRDAVDAAMPYATGRAAAMLALVGSTSHGTGGRLTEALRLNDIALAAHLAIDAPLLWPLAIHRYIRMDALSIAGLVDEAAAFGLNWYADALSQNSLLEQAYAASSLSKVSSRQGRIGTAVQWGALAVRLNRECGRPAEQSYALVYLMLALSLRGSADAAAAAFAEYETLPPGGAEFGPEVLHARGWMAVAANDLNGGLALLQQAAELADAHGSWGTEAAVRHDIARLGQAEAAAPRLAELADLIEGELVHHRAAHAAALVAGDAAALDAVAAAFERAGTVLIAAEAFNDAAIAWRRAGEGRKATASERNAARLAPATEGARTPGLGAASAAVVALTPRELDVARLAAAGMTNRAIADRLFLSLRTVENKLHAAYSKLGISGREELSDALIR